MTTPLDPVTLEVIRNALPAVANEMAVDLQRTSYNMMIYEVRDFCTALVNTAGELICQNVGGVSHFVADLGVVIADGMRRYGRQGFAPGDVVITNHQAVAGQHLNNIVIYAPYFHDGELLMFAMVRAHWIDVGGMSTGFGAGPTVADPWVEGLQLDQLKIYEAGKLNETLYRVLKDNIRFPESSRRAGSRRGAWMSCSENTAARPCSRRSRRSSTRPKRNAATWSRSSPMASTRPRPPSTRTASPAASRFPSAPRSRSTTAR
jgi:N-methylhydantoinase B